MGFWHTGYIEFHEPIGFGEAFQPSPLEYRCQHCSAVFDNADALLSHRFEAHPYNRPVLLINGNELGNTPIRVTRKLSAADVRLGHCTNSWVNGHKVSVDRLGKALADKRVDTTIVKLSNGDVEAEFRLEFEIPDESDLDGIEQSFVAIAKKKRLDLRAVEEFISDSRGYATAVGYCDGICEYLYGVLAKERSPDLSLPYSSYHEKFMRAADKLKDYDRRLSRTISALIAFHFNQFDLAANMLPGARVCLVSERYGRWVSDSPQGADKLLGKAVDERIEKLLSDYETDEILAISFKRPDEVLRKSEELESRIKEDIPEFDKPKLRILLAENYVLGEKTADAIRHARALRNNPSFGAWAERLLDRLA